MNELCNGFAVGEQATVGRLLHCWYPLGDKEGVYKEICDIP